MTTSIRMSEPRLDWRTKGLPPAAEGMSGAEIGALGLELLAGDLPMPAAVLRADALAHNVAAMQAFADRAGAHLCPHGKTTMSPELFAMQLAAGAWGLTAATAHHVRIYRRLGVARILLANQLVAPADLDLVMAELAADPAFDFYCLVDSSAVADRLAEAARRHAPGRPVQVLIEAGVGGGRTGVRGLDEARALARHLAKLPELAVRGVETFEGVRQANADDRQLATRLLDLTLAVVADVARDGLLAGGPVLVSAGGSGVLDLVTAKLPATIDGRAVERVIRPGCYVTHDHGIYERLTRPGGRLIAGLPDLRPALEVWAVVQARPEPGLAIAGAGRRDLGFDSDLPRPIHVHRPGSDRAPRPATGLEVVKLWDQHLALSVADGTDLAVGDLVGFGISHPCSTFDRWRALLTVDEGWRVNGAVTTLF